jgi:aldose sugar dehydrogenase
LVDFEGKGTYSDPEFVWGNRVGPTALKFLNSSKYGKEYQNDMFVADFHNGEGFGGITDLEVGPDGYLYVFSLH